MIDTYVRDFSRWTAGSPEQRDAVVRELQAHLQEAQEAGLDNGVFVDADGNVAFNGPEGVAAAEAFPVVELRWADVCAAVTSIQPAALVLSLAPAEAVPGRLRYVADTLALLKKELAGSRALLGFGGSPWTRMKRAWITSGRTRAAAVMLSSTWRNGITVRSTSL